MSYESSLDRNSETSQSLSLLVLHATVEEFVTINSSSSTSSPSGDSSLSFVSLSFFLYPFFFLVICFIFFDLITDGCGRGLFLGGPSCGSLLSLSVSLPSVCFPCLRLVIDGGNWSPLNYSGFSSPSVNFHPDSSGWRV